MNLSLRSAAVLLTVLFGVGLVSCEHDDDDDCHTHVSNGLLITHCHDDDDFHFDDDDHHHHIEGEVDNGQVVIVVTDNETPELSAFHVTLHEAALQSSEVEPQTVYASPQGQRVDLLSLRGSSETRLFEFLVGRTQVRPGTYESIRLTLSDPALTLRSGEVVDGAQVSLVSEGKIDIGFSEPLALGPGELAYLILDFDVERSLSRVPADTSGDGPTWSFRPLVLIDVVREDAAAEITTPVMVTGRVTDLGEGAEAFTLELADGRGRVDVALIAGSTVLGQDLETADVTAVRVGDSITVRGALSPDSFVEAETVVTGSSSRVAGTIEWIRDEGAGLLLALQDAERTKIVEFVVDGTARFSIRRQTVEGGDLTPGRRAAVLLKTWADPERPPVAVWIDLDLDDALPPPERVPAGVVLSGIVLSIDTQSRTLKLAGSSTGRKTTVNVPLAAPIFFLESSDGFLWQSPVVLDDLEVGMRLETIEPTAADDAERILVLTAADTPSEPSETQ